jgi:DNA-binding beta-propeller fold protein YncE
MLKKIPVILLLLTCSAIAQVKVNTIDLLKFAGYRYNAAGPHLVIADGLRNRIITANTLSSSVSIIDGETDKVLNIPVGKRGFQHLKGEAIAINDKNGNIYIIGDKAVFIILPEIEHSFTINTDKQFESIAVDEYTGNVFVSGRECKDIGVIRPGEETIDYIPWVQTEEKLLNMNQTPPPPIRKVITTNDASQMLIAIDGYTSTMHLFDSRSGKFIKSRDLKLTSGGRWHNAGYNRETHCLYIVTETAKRKVIEAAKIDVLGTNDVIVKLPELTEGVGMRYNKKLDQVYIPYDNHPSVHCVDFAKNGEITDMAIPDYGNDASAVDEKNDLLYIGSWARGEVFVIDLKTKKFVKNIKNLGIIPHMFAMTFNESNGMLYFPKGASAVNGCFGAALTKLNPINEKQEKIYQGWSPIDLIEVKDRNSFLVFNNEDEFAEVGTTGKVTFNRLPYEFPLVAEYSPDKNIYLSYGPHQSYWPVVYIWGAKNGILLIDKENLEFYDRRIPRQAMQVITDKKKRLLLAQNNWGKEEQFIGVIKDEVRSYEVGDRIKIKDTVEREVTQRIMKYDAKEGRYYLVKAAEADTANGTLYIFDEKNDSSLAILPVGVYPTDLAFDDNNIYVCNFGSGSVSIINKKDNKIKIFASGKNPLKICMHGGKGYLINHTAGTLQMFWAMDNMYKLPVEAQPDNITSWNDRMIITAHNSKEFYILEFLPDTEKFNVITKFEYPFGETSFAGVNNSFYMTGQFGDAVFELNRMKTATDGRLWITDFLSGKLFILEK